MINKSLIQDLRITFLCVWVILMLYGVYRFHKKTNFRSVMCSDIEQDDYSTSQRSIAAR